MAILAKIFYNTEIFDDRYKNCIKKTVCRKKLNAGHPMYSWEIYKECITKRVKKKQSAELLILLNNEVPITSKQILKYEFCFINPWNFLYY